MSAKKCLHCNTIYSSNEDTCPKGCNYDQYSEKKTPEVFEPVSSLEQVVNEVATGHELNLIEIINKVVEHKQSDLILKAIIHRMLKIDWEGTQETINAAVFYHPIVGEGTHLLDIHTVTP